MIESCVVSSFSIDDMLLTFDIKSVLEVGYALEVESVPRSRSWIEGICNLRGRIIPVLNGHRLFGIDNKKNEAGRFMIVQNRLQIVAMRVSRINNIFPVDLKEIQNVQVSIKERSPLNVSVFDGSLMVGGEILHMLNSHKFF